MKKKCWKNSLQGAVKNVLKDSGGWAIQERSLPFFIFEELMTEGSVKSLKQFPQNAGVKIEKAKWPLIKNSSQNAKKTIKTHVSIHPDLIVLREPFNKIEAPADGKFSLRNFGSKIHLVVEMKSTMNYDSTKAGCKRIPTAVCTDLATIIALNQELESSGAQFLCVFLNYQTNKYRGPRFSEEDFRQVWDKKWHGQYPNIYAPFQNYRNHFLLIN